MRRRSLGALVVMASTMLVSTVAVGAQTTLDGVSVTTTAAGTTQVVITTSSQYFTIGANGTSVYEAGQSTPIFTIGTGPGTSGAQGGGVGSIATDSSGDLYLSQGTAINELTDPGTPNEATLPIVSKWSGPLFGLGNSYGQGIIVTSSGDIIAATEGEPFQLYLLSNNCTVTTCPYGVEPVTNQPTLAAGWKIFQIPVPGAAPGELAGMNLNGANLVVGESGGTSNVLELNQIWQLSQSGSWTQFPVTPTPGNSSSDAFEVIPEMMAFDSFGNLLIAYENSTSAGVSIYLPQTASDLDCTSACPYGLFDMPAGTVVNFFNDPLDGVSLTVSPQFVAKTASGSSVDLLGFSSSAKDLYVNNAGSLDAVATNQFLDPSFKLKALSVKRNGTKITVTIAPRLEYFPVTLRVQGLNKHKRLAWLPVTTATTNQLGQVTFRYKGHGVVDVLAKSDGKQVTSANFTF